ncbi:hypothetical protein P7C71_g4076, partial [Lecanoromycetidae sp. Uapishka_2]
MRDTFFTTGGGSKGTAPSIDSGGLSNDTVKLKSMQGQSDFTETHGPEDDLLTAASWELVEKPTVQGLMTGVTGAAGDLGGIVFLLISRYSGQRYGQTFWIIGVITVAGNLLVSWIRPIPKGQLGGR